MAYEVCVQLLFTYGYKKIDILYTVYRCICSKCDRLSFLCGDSDYFRDRGSSIQSGIYRSISHEEVKHETASLPVFNFINTGRKVNCDVGKGLF